MNSVIGLGAGENGHDNLYENNNLHDNLFGIYMQGPIDAARHYVGNQRERVVNNRVYNNVLAGIGISVDWPSSGGDLNTYIQGNTIFGNGQYGIVFEQGSGHVSISNNEIYDNGQDGILVKGTSVVTINGNNVYDNKEWGIATYCKTCCPNDQDAPGQFGGQITLDGNTIANNGNGSICGVQLKDAAP